MTTCTCNSFSSATSAAALTVSNTSTGDGIQCSASSSTKSACWGDNSSGGYGIVGSASGGNTPTGVWGINHNTNVGYGVRATADGAGYGLYASAGASGTAVFGFGGYQGIGGYFAGLKVYDPGNSMITGVMYPDGCCALFTGGVEVQGFLGKGGGGFFIDHPKDPENKYLFHGFVESDTAKNIYSGDVTFDANGEAKVEFDDWFDAVNTDTQMSVTARGKAIAGLYWDQVDTKTFKIGGSPGERASWVLVCKRSDPWQKANHPGIVVEKSKELRGTYKHPKLYGKDDSHREHKNPDAHAPEMELKRSEIGVK